MAAAHVAEMTEAGERAFMDWIACRADIDGKQCALPFQPQQDPRRIGGGKRFGEPRHEETRLERTARFFGSEKKGLQPPHRQNERRGIATLCGHPFRVGSFFTRPVQWIAGKRNHRPPSRLPDRRQT
jgi:hypothetical protein